MSRLSLVLGLGLGAGVLWLASCARESPEHAYAAAEAAARNTETLEQATEQFRAFLDRYPKHPQAPNALKQLAMIAQQKGDMDGAISHYSKLLTDYPKSDQADEAQFMIAFIYEEYLHDLDQARVAYQRVIDNYPSSELAESAQRLLPNVGRDPEEWVEFQDGPASP
ncbi:MAG: tetratricopeptide repeat protein [Candidatus Latescibacterota bacterium]